MHDTTPDNAFWQFACTVYRQAPVADALLQLQDEHHLNINMLLVMWWLGEQGIALADSDIANLHMAIRALDDDIIRPLRQIRRTVKQQTELAAIHYLQMQQLELAFEQEAIHRLYRHSLTINRRRCETSCIRHNLSAYVLTTTPAAIPALALLLEQIGKHI